MICVMWSGQLIGRFLYFVLVPFPILDINYLGHHYYASNIASLVLFTMRYNVVPVRET